MPGYWMAKRAPAPASSGHAKLKSASMQSRLLRWYATTTADLPGAAIGSIPDWLPLRPLPTRPPASRE